MVDRGLVERRAGVTAWDRFRGRLRSAMTGAIRELAHELLAHPFRTLGVIDLLRHRAAECAAVRSRLSPSGRAVGRGAGRDRSGLCLRARPIRGRSQPHRQPQGLPPSRPPAQRLRAMVSSRPQAALVSACRHPTGAGLANGRPRRARPHPDASSADDGCERPAPRPAPERLGAARPSASGRGSHWSEQRLIFRTWSFLHGNCRQELARHLAPEDPVLAVVGILLRPTGSCAKKPIAVPVWSRTIIPRRFTARAIFSVSGGRFMAADRGGRKPQAGALGDRAGRPVPSVRCAGHEYCPAPGAGRSIASACLIHGERRSLTGIVPAITGGWSRWRPSWVRKPGPRVLGVVAAGSARRGSSPRPSWRARPIGLLARLPELPQRVGRGLPDRHVAVAAGGGAGVRRNRDLGVDLLQALAPGGVRVVRARP